ncbi:hypothetical protein RHGRI_025313 [Rhododendron griersonianum]|uniref:Uncharacterized protein n=1 Tax=Rhododendron griersonianum TaxID=479676 RepID=A0AAV6IPT4_9ERIC|nr:hypothetical protein RHGRI_025313 [Rhododendron griersonianum]
MAEFKPPSFSLGLDFDLDSEPQTTVPKNPPFPRQPSSNPSFLLIEDDDDLEIPDPPWTLKRLRRGPPSESSSAAAAVAQKWELVEMGCNNVDDEIEEFSSQEDRHRARPKHGSSMAWWSESIGGAYEKLGASDAMDCRHL